MRTKERSRSIENNPRTAALPNGCHRCFTKDGRVFYTDEFNRTTSWLHPVSKRPVGTEHFERNDLPIGWEQAITKEGAIYFINHNKRTTTFEHPTSGLPAADTNIFKLISPHTPSYSPDRNSLRRPQEEEFIVQTRPESLSLNQSNPRGFEHNRNRRGAFPAEPDRHSVAISPSFEDSRHLQSQQPHPLRAQSQLDLREASVGFEDRDRLASYSGGGEERDFELKESASRGLSLQDLRLAGRSQSVETLLRQNEQNANRPQAHYQSEFNLYDKRGPPAMNFPSVGSYDPDSGLPIVRNPSAKVLQGWLLRDEKGFRHSKSKWHDRWCYIVGKQLVCCKSQDSNARRAVFELMGYAITPTPAEDTQNRYTFKLEKEKEKTLLFAAQSQEARSRWIYALRIAAQPLADPKPFVLQQHHFQNRGYENKENRYPDYPPDSMSEANMVPLVNPVDPEHDTGQPTNPMVTAESDPLVDEGYDKNGRRIERVVYYREYVDPLETTRQSVKRERANSRSRTRQNPPSYASEHEDTLGRESKSKTGTRERIELGSGSNRPDHNDPASRRGRSSSRKHKKGGGNFEEPKDQAQLPAEEEERLQEERDLHVYRKLQLDRTFSREEFYKRGGRGAEQGAPVSRTGSMTSLNDGGNRPPAEVNEDDFIAEPEHEVQVEATPPMLEDKPSIPRSQVVDDLVLFLTDMRNDYAILEVRRDDMMKKLQKQHFQILLQEYLQHDQSVKDRVVVPISDDVELHVKQGDFNASKEAFQRLINMNELAVKCAAPADNTSLAQFEQDKLFKSGLKELLNTDTACQQKCFDSVQQLIPFDLLQFTEKSSKCLRDIELSIEDVLKMRQQDTTGLLSEPIDIQILFDRIQVQRQRLLLDIQALIDALNYWLELRKAPEFVKPLQDVNVQEGEQIEFVCQIASSSSFSHVKQSDHISVDWQVNSLKIVDTPQSRVLRDPDGTTNRLIVPDARIEDAGTFYCVATNKITGDSAVSACKLSVFAVQPDGEPPIILAELNNQSSVSGAVFRVKCNISGNPEPVVRWFLEGRQLLDGDNCRILQGEGSSELVIDSISKKHEGRLAVEAENEFGKAHSMCYLTVQDPPPKKESSLGDGYNSYSQSSTSIYKNIRNIAETDLDAQSSKGQLRPNSTGLRPPVDRVEEDLIEADQRGVSEGDLNAALDLALVPDRDVEQEPPRPKVIATAPKIRSKLSRVAVVAGDDIEMRCSIEASPRPFISWFRNSVALQSDDRIRFSEDGQDKILSIEDVSEQDQGLYFCVAQNQVGKAETSASLQVFQAPRPDPPKNYPPSRGSNVSLNKETSNYESKSSYSRSQYEYESRDVSQKHYSMNQLYEGSNPLSSHMDPPFVVDQLRSTVVDQGQTAHFRVRVIGRPQPKVVWTKDGKPIDFAANYSRFSREMNGDVYKLIVKNVNESDRGIYAISAENDYGKALNSADLEVTTGRALAKPGAPKLTAGLENVQVVVGQSAVLRCLIEGQPVPQVTWMKDNFTLMVTPRIKMQQKGQEYTLTIEQFSPVDVGVYQCKATNQHGSVTSSATLQLARDSNDKRYVLTPASNVFSSTTAELVRSASTEEHTRVLERLKGKMLQEGQPLALSCRIQVAPDPVSFYWEKDGRLLENDGQNLMIARKNDFQSLYIPKVSMDHGGIYRCTGENAIGSKAVTAAEIIVKPDLSLNGPPLLSLSSREPSYSRLYRPGSQVSLRSASLQNLNQSNSSVPDLTRNSAYLNTRRLGSQEGLSVHQEEGWGQMEGGKEEKQQQQQEEQYVTETTTTSTNRTSGYATGSNAKALDVRTSSSDLLSPQHPQPYVRDHVSNLLNSSSYSHVRSTSALSNSTKNRSTDPTEADIEKMERLILNKQVPPHLSSPVQQQQQQSSMMGSKNNSSGRGGGGGGSNADLRSRLQLPVSPDNAAAAGHVTDPSDIDRQVLMPQKVVIPERYFDARAANSPVENTLERKERQMRTENVRKMVLTQTMLETTSQSSFEERAQLVEQQARLGQMASKFGQHVTYQKPQPPSTTYSSNAGFSGNTSYSGRN